MYADSTSQVFSQLASVLALVAAMGTVGCTSPAVSEEDGENVAQSQEALTDYEESHVSGNVWYVDNNPWLMKGVNWDPSEPCEWHTQYNWSRADGDAALMQANRFNTIRTYGFTSAKAGLPDGGNITPSQLDSFYNRGIRVILTVHAAPGDSTWTGVAYNGTNVVAATGDFTQAAKDRISLLAGHPAVIALGVGNEIHWNYFYTKDPGGAWSNGWTVQNVISHANHVTNKVRTLTSKPVSVSWGNTGEINLVGQLNADIISYQIYNNLSLDNIFNLHPQNSGKPFFMSEFGADSWNSGINAEDEVSQKNGNRNLFQQILNNATSGAGGTAGHKIVGGTVFSFSDGWWKAAGNACNHETGGIAPGVGPHPDLTFNEEWWGLCRGDGAVTRSCRQTLGDLGNLFAGYSGGGGGGGAQPAARIFYGGDSNAASPSEWDAGHWKGACGSGGVVGGLSQRPSDGFANAVNCGYGSTGTFTGNHMATVAFSGGDNRRSQRAGDWDSGHYKGECGLNEYVSGVSMDPNTKKIHALRCAAGSLQNGGQNACETRNLSINGDDTGNPGIGDWDPNNYKASCSVGKVAYGVSMNPTTGKPHRILCCNW